MTPVATTLEFVSVTRRFRDGARGEVLALQDCSLKLCAGECATVEGPSGSGKSTLLALACGLLLPTEGEVRFLGEDFSRTKESFRAQNRREYMGVVLQELALIASMRVDENVLLASALNMPTVAIRERMQKALRQFAIEPLETAAIRTLSGGERQRVALARAAMNERPKLIVLDEPTARLDDDNTQRVKDWIASVCSTGTTVLIATHDARVSEQIAGLTRYTLTDRRLHRVD